MKSTIAKYLYALLVAVLLSSCIGDDILDDTIPAELRINNAIDSLAIGATYQFESSFFNNIGLLSRAETTWSSSAPDVISITSQGLAEALQAGETNITATTIDNNDMHEASIRLVAGGTTSSSAQSKRAGMIKTTSSYQLTGDFVLETQNDGSLLLDISDNYRASQALPGLYIYLSNNPNSRSGAHEIGAVEVFEGAHSYEINGVGISDYNYLLYYCKPFNVKVGDGPIEG